MKKILSLLCSAVMLFAATDFSAVAKTDSKKDDQKKESSKEKVSKYDKTFIKDKSCITAKAEGGFITLHKVNGKVYIEMPLSTFDKEMLIASTISETSAADIATIGFKPTNPMHVKYLFRDSTVFLSEVNQIPDYNTEDKARAHAVEKNTIAPIIDSYKLTCWNNDSTSVVFDATSMFNTNYAKLAPLKSGSSGIINMKVSFNSKAGYIGDIKAFEDNVTIKSTLSYNVTADMMRLVLLKSDQPVTVGVTRTILLLPEEKMRPRLADTRLGIFLTGKMDMDSDVDKLKSYSVINRWDVQPSDSVAWAKGELVKPVKPIVFYLDNAFPALWRESVRNGILRWNTAFEAIGFKEVVHVLDFPEDDPNFDPDNLKYSCIRYVPSMIANAMGPSWVDPTTGEIINASVIIYNDVVKLVNNWRFTQTSQLDARARDKKLGKDILNESIEYVVAHEVGHCLGFMHNMSASASYPVDSLRSATFTKAYGTTPSIMDYARFNYVAQPEDKGVSLDPPYLGVYDYYLVKYAYKPVLEAKSMKEEKPIIESWVDEKAGDPRYRYGKQQVLKRYDPSAIEEDLGDDPIKASEYGIKNLKYILSHFNEWMPNEVDSDATLREERYVELSKQYNRYLRAVMLNIGGIYLTEVKPGTVGKISEPVSKERQSEAVKWLINELKNCDWLENKEITDNFSLRVGLEPIIQYYTALELFGTNQNVILSSHLAESEEEAYSLRNWLDDMYDGIWESAVKSKKLEHGDVILQKLYLTFLTSEITKKSSLVRVQSLTSANTTHYPSIDHLVAFGLDESGLLEANIETLRAIEEEHGVGYIASQLATTNFGRPGYNWQYRVNLRTIDESKAMLHGEAVRIYDLVTKAAKRSKGDVKVHYQAMQYELEKALK